MSSLKQKQTKAEALMVTMAESIGSTLGTITAKAKAVPDTLSHNGFVKSAEREGKKIVRKSKKLAGKLKKTAKNAKSSKLAKAGRRGLRRATTAVKRAKSSIS